MASHDLLSKVMAQNMRLQKEIKNMMTLDVCIEVDNECEAASVTFRNGQIEFSLDGIPITDYFEAAEACKRKINWKGEMIKVVDGIVSITISNVDGYQGGYMTYKIPAKHCCEAFMKAYDELSAVEFQ